MNELLRDYETLREKLNRIEKAYLAFEDQWIDNESEHAFCQTK